MKQLIAVLALLSAGVWTSLFAQESIDAKIEQIHTAPAQERYRLMNALKKELAAMNAQQRAEAIAKLRSGVEGNTEAPATVPDRSHSGTPMQQVRQNDQMNQMQQIRRQTGTQQKPSPVTPSSPGHGQNGQGR